MALEIYKKTDFLFRKMYTLCISEHTFRHCKLTLTSLVLAGVLPHTLISFLNHFQLILFHKPLSLFLQAFTGLPHSENIFPQPICSSYYCSSLIPFTSKPSWKNSLYWLSSSPQHLFSSSPLTILVLLLAHYWKLLSLRSPWRFFKIWEESLC